VEIGSCEKKFEKSAKGENRDQNFSHKLSQREPCATTDIVQSSLGEELPLGSSSRGAQKGLPVVRWIVPHRMFARFCFPVSLFLPYLCRWNSCYASRPF